MTFAHVRLADVGIAVDQAGMDTLNGIIYYVGGCKANNHPVLHSNETWAYNPADNTWTQMADYPIAEGVQSLCVRAVGTKLYGIGGHNSESGNFYKKVYEYDPDVNTWTERADMPTAREDFGSAVVGTKIYCFGGLTNTPGAYTRTKAMEVYDTETNTWDETKADLPDFKHFGDFGCAHDGKVYAIGGSNSFDNYPTLYPVGIVYEYNPVGDAWTAKASIPALAGYREAVSDGTLIYVVSGAVTSTTTYTDIIYSYNPATDVWAYVGQAPYSARGAALAVYNGDVYMCGGFRDTFRTSLYKLVLS